MRGLLGSFYAKLAALFLVLLVALSVAYVAVTFRAAMRLIDEVELKVNSGYAANIAAELAPATSGGLELSRIRRSIHEMMVVNPKVEIYLLDASGKVLAFFAGSSDPVKERAVDVRPIARYLSGGPSDRMVLGDDPREPGKLRPFSAASLDLGGGRRGFVYVILGGERFDSALRMLKESYFARVAGAILLLILVFTGLCGLALFALLTRRLRVLSEAVDAFERGDLARRVPTRSSDEVDRLGTSFNQMADTIAGNMERLKAVDRLRRELIANVSHDLRSPLSSIRGYLETILIRDEALSREELHSYLDVTLRNTRTLEKLVGELFELSKLETDNYQPVFEQVMMAELVQDVALKLRSHAERQRVRIVTVLPPEVPPVRADIGLMERVLSNLIENAIRFTPVDGVIEIALVVSQGDRVRVTVSDNGCGIGRDDLPFIFDRFYRVERSRARSSDQLGTGSGLGLAIVKRIVELHGSDIVVSSEVDVGSRFSFELRRFQELTAQLAGSS